MINDKIIFKYTNSKLGLSLTNEIYEGKILEENIDKVKVKIEKDKNTTSEFRNVGEIVWINKKQILKGYTEEKKESKQYKKESLMFIELKEQVRQFCEQNNYILTEDETVEFEMEDDDSFTFLENMLEFEKLKRKCRLKEEKEVNFDENRVKVGLFNDINGNSFVCWYIIK